MRFGERYADGKTTTEILHVVQNDGLGVGRNSVGLGRGTEPSPVAKVRAGIRSADYLPTWGWGGTRWALGGGRSRHQWQRSGLESGARIICRHGGGAELARSGTSFAGGP